MTRPEYVPDDAEDITDHGADPNPDDPGLGAAEEVLAAIHAAASAAGAGGAIYVPAGTYHFGSRSFGKLTSFGEREPAGISIYGDGPGETTVALTGHMSPGDPRNQNAFHYERTNHGDVEIRGLEVDGNAGDLGSLANVNGAADAFSLDGGHPSNTSFSFYNVAIRNCYTRGIRCRRYVSSVEHCTFENIGIQSRNDGGSNFHPLDALRTPRGRTTTISNSKIIDCPGSAINIRGNDGEYHIHNLYAAGTGVQMLKLSGGERVELRHVFHRANTDSLEERLDGEPDTGFIGRHFIQSLGDRGDRPVTVDMEHVETRDLSQYAFQSRDSEGQPAEITWTGDMVAIHNACFVSDNEVIRDRRGGSFVVDVGRLSVHGSDGRVLETNQSSGTIETLHRDDNSGGLGRTGGVSIGTDNQGGDPFEPDVPSAEDVGADAPGNGGGDNGEDENGNGDNGDDGSDNGDAGLFDEWTPRWESDEDDWQVVEGSEFAGEHALAFENGAGDRTRYAFSWDEAGEPSDVEVLDRFRVPQFHDDTAAYHARVYLRSGGDAGSEEGYWIQAEEDGDAFFRLGKYDSDGDLVTFETFGTPQEGTFFYRRFRAEGDTLAAKVWRAGEDEPSEWQVEVTDEEWTDGWVGVGSYDPDLTEFDVFAVGTNGADAPLPGGNEPPGISWVTPTAEETVNGTVTLQVEATHPDESDDALEIEYSVDGESWSSASYNEDTGYHEAEWDSSEVSDGTHWLEARMNDEEEGTAKTAVEVTVENGSTVALTVDTVDLGGVTDSAVTAQGELTELEGADEATVGFEWRESGADSWNVTGEQTLDGPATFETEIDGLEPETDYEVRTFAEGEDVSETGEVLEVTTDSDDDDGDDEPDGPVIEEFDVHDRSEDGWTRFDVDWTVSEEAGNLDTVVTQLWSDGRIVKAKTTSTNGEHESYTHVMRVRGDVDKVGITVTDTENNASTESTDV